jgi:molybdopterin-containing oxidoreductase family iron-sulfur binding subunit
MNKTKSTTASRETGPKYWRSLDQLEGAPEFSKWVDHEFPSGAEAVTDPVSRRNFVKLMSASFLLAGLGMSGCRRPEEKIIPFAKQPHDYVHGQAKHFASAMPTRTGAIPLLVKQDDGRPTKIEGNSEHPDSNGGTNAAAQASILNLYDPDRATRFAKDRISSTRTLALDEIAAIATAAAKNRGEGLHILSGHADSPTRDRVRANLLRKLPKAKWHEYEPIDHDVHRRAATKAFGLPVKPYYHLDKAERILTLDCDFIGSEEDSHVSVRQFAKGRKIDPQHPEMNRLYAVEALFTLTGAAADHRLRVPASAVHRVAAQIALKVLAGLGIASSKFPGVKDTLIAHGAAGGVDPKWIDVCADDLMSSKGRCVVMAGQGQSEATHLLALLMNVALGNINKTVTLRKVSENKSGSIGDLTKALNAETGKKTLVILGGNPVYDAPANLEFGEAIESEEVTTLRLGYYEDESTPKNGWNIPQAHYLESWGDALTSDGTAVPVQPLMAPLFDGMTEIELLARLAGEAVFSPYELTRATFFARLGSRSEDAWKKFLHDGYDTAGAAAPMKTVKLISRVVNEVVRVANKEANVGPDLREVIFYADSKIDDGRYNNNGWLQEAPDPITKLTWDNAVLMSPTTANELGLKNMRGFKDGFHDKAFKEAGGTVADFHDGEHNLTEKGEFHQEVVTLKLGSRTISGPAWVVPGMADNVFACALGYGRDGGATVSGGTGRVGDGTGFNAYRLRTEESLKYGLDVKVERTDATIQLASTQEHGTIDGRSLIREANLDKFTDPDTGHGDFAKGMNMPHPEGIEDLPNGGIAYKNPLDELRKNATHSWGMVIDMNSCVGCNACVLACQSENNVPIVGKEQVVKGREMHWIRMDRYFSGDVHNPQMAHQIMVCQHCEAAPCENVCPVNATVHDDEGLNLMIYNRCVGTRYCSNNCPYKVRRFNYFDYNKRPLNDLYNSPLNPLNRKDGEWELKRWAKDRSKGNIDEDQWDLLKLAKNPSVTVRMRGVMEKCTYCIQRIEGAKIAQKVKAGDSADVKVPDGTIKTACQQACPAEAIEFGNIDDPKSKVTVLKAQARDYEVLGYLKTKPRTTYLGRVRNPNKDMPDYSMPETYKEWVGQGNHLQTHGHEGDHDHDHGHEDGHKHSDEGGHKATTGKGDHH